MTSIADQEAALAAQIIDYCKANALSLNGIVAELEAGQPLDAERLEHLTTYCDVQCLTLGGLLDKACELHDAMQALEAEFEHYNEDLEASKWAEDMATMRSAELNYGY
ncbi:hypothetical protein Dolphis_81 [Pseudomonas phage Dolphis]|nr:hypothetical protein Dolphis_81 [Pseudomonas phage Dolphis]